MIPSYERHVTLKPRGTYFQQHSFEICFEESKNKRFSFIEDFHDKVHFITVH
jgi:hypothetical protein